MVLSHIAGVKAAEGPISLLPPRSSPSPCFSLLVSKTKHLLEFRFTKTPVLVESHIYHNNFGGSEKVMQHCQRHIKWLLCNCKLLQMEVSYDWICLRNTYPTIMHKLTRYLIINQINRHRKHSPAGVALLYLQIRTICSSSCNSFTFARWTR